MVKKGEDRLKKTFKQVTFNIPVLEKKLTDINTEILTIQYETVALNLAKERELMHHETLSNTLSEKLVANHMEMMKTLTAIFYDKHYLRKLPKIKVL